ncbi:tetratricopeptide repeat protein [uncultured Ramlibacter sp.]|uniref:tetratricopeptide repeat protein n=1 Tax=uncultured Ramlibacter sp. TaxID=260755 RepID=UPI00262249DD|nr:tetratricopeptide repeat-containing glycosyltransferase family protein [uncultured Ramlibacter sp.]
MADLQTLREALACQRQGNWALAEVLCRSYLQGAPCSADALGLLGLIEAHKGKLSEGAALLQRAAQAAPANPGLHFNLGLVQQEAGRHAQALAAFDAALRLRGDVDVFHQARGIALKNLDRPQEALAAYDAALQLNPRLFSAHHNRAVALKQLGRLDEAIDAWRAALALQPRSADLYNSLGIALHQQGQHAQALAAFEQAVALQPDAMAMMNAGVSLLELKRHDDALAMLDRALALQPQLADARLNRGNVLAALERHGEAIADYQAVLAARPGDVDALMNLANTLRDSGDHSQAQPWYDQALALDPGNAGVRWNRALSLLATGDYAQGWRDYQARAQADKLGHRARDFGVPLWLGDASVAGRTVLLHAEQGLGDTLQFCRYAAAVAALGARVVLEVQAPLVGLLQGLEGVAQLVARGDALSPIDLHCPLLSVPLALGTTLDTIPASVPYLRAEPALVAHWQQFLAQRKAATGRPQIGVSWSGNAGYWNDHRRSMAKAVMQRGLPPCADYWSLQKPGDASDGVPDGQPILEFAQSDFANTAAQICALDAVISVDTSIGHLTGALGRPLWLLLSRPADWRWLEERTDSPWYPTARLLRQTTPGDWAPLFAQLPALVRAL